MNRLGILGLLTGAEQLRSRALAVPSPVANRAKERARAEQERQTLVKRSSVISRQQLRRAAFQGSFARVNAEFQTGETTFTVPRRARRKIARNRLRIQRKAAA